MYPSRQAKAETFVHLFSEVISSITSPCSIVVSVLDCRSVLGLNAIIVVWDFSALVSSYPELRML